MNTQQLAYDITDDLIDHGTEPFRIAFGVLADAVREAHPGIAEALTDWEGSEAARLRAFALAREALREPRAVAATEQDQAGKDEPGIADRAHQDEAATAGVPWAA